MAADPAVDEELRRSAALRTGRTGAKVATVVAGVLMLPLIGGGAAAAYSMATAHEQAVVAAQATVSPSGDPSTQAPSQTPSEGTSASPSTDPLDPGYSVTTPSADPSASAEPGVMGGGGSTSEPGAAGEDDRADAGSGADGTDAGGSASGSDAGSNGLVDRVDRHGEGHYARTETVTDAGEVVYTIQWGDTLSEISEHYGVSMHELAAANGIDDLDLIYAEEDMLITDMELLIPQPHIR